MTPKERAAMQQALDALEGDWNAMKTAELTGAALDWAVAKCEFGSESEGTEWGISAHYKGVIVPKLKEPDCYYYPSSNWKIGGPIIEREGLEIAPFGDGWRGSSYWNEHYQSNSHVPIISMFGKTPLIAAMRCYVASKLGDDVTVPEELI